MQPFARRPWLEAEGRLPDSLIACTTRAPPVGWSSPHRLASEGPFLQPPSLGSSTQTGLEK